MISNYKQRSRIIQARAKAAGRDVGAYVADLFEKMAQMGYGYVVRMGRTVRFVAKQNPNCSNPSKSVGSGENPPESTCNKGTSNLESQDPEVSKILVSLLDVENSGGNPEEFIGTQVEVRSSVSGKFKYRGEMTDYDQKSGFVSVKTQDGSKYDNNHVREVFAIANVIGEKKAPFIIIPHAIANSENTELRLM